jgi:hypothetical protein
MATWGRLLLILAFAVLARTAWRTLAVVAAQRKP